MEIKNIWESDNFLRRQMTGRIQASEVIDSILKLSGDERFDNLKFILGDWSQAELEHFTGEDVKQLCVIAETISKSNAQIRNAIVTGNKEANQAVAQLYVLTKPLKWKVKVFQNIENARDWLS